MYVNNYLLLCFIMSTPPRNTFTGATLSRENSSVDYRQSNYVTRRGEFSFRKGRV